MFSGIVETRSRILDARAEGGLIRLTLSRPPELADLKIGDSVAVNGVCLTVEKFDASTMLFALGAETLRITGWSAEKLKGTEVNVEGSLRFGDRIHGHLVAGHVDAIGEVVRVADAGGSTDIDIRAPRSLLPYLWKKGSWAVEGVSLTVNDVKDDIISVCLIPETLKRTTLQALRPGSRVNLEADSMARALVNMIETMAEQQGLDLAQLAKTQGR